MSKRFLHVAFRWNEVKTSEIEPTLNAATDWIRYAPNCWILWTGRTPQQWLDLLKPHLGEGEHVFICAMDMTVRQGWLPRTVWDWINKSRV